MLTFAAGRRETINALTRGCRRSRGLLDSARLLASARRAARQPAHAVARVHGPRASRDVARACTEQMALAAQCDHALIANSTYAWWCAWLGDQRSDERRTVIAPQMLRDWDVDILPDRWIVVASD